MLNKETADAEISKLESMYQVLVKRRVILTDLTLRLRADLDRLLGASELAENVEDAFPKKDFTDCGTIYALQDESAELSGAIENLGLQIARLHTL